MNPEREINVHTNVMHVVYDIPFASANLFKKARWLSA